MSTLKLVCQCALSDRIPLRSFYVALAGGTILNLINQQLLVPGMGRPAYRAWSCCRIAS
jgi:hypothetical protein